MHRPGFSSRNDLSCRYYCWDRDTIARRRIVGGQIRLMRRDWIIAVVVDLHYSLMFVAIGLVVRKRADRSSNTDSGI